MSKEYTKDLLRVVVARICQTIGWHSIQETALELLVDILHRYLHELAETTYRYTELYGRVEPNLDDVGLAFCNHGIKLLDVGEYINFVGSVAFPFNIPKYPIRKNSNLNFLKPGSKEVVIRPVHINEYFPPIYSEKQEIKYVDENDVKHNVIQENTIDVETVTAIQSNFFKKPYTFELDAQRKNCAILDGGRRLTRDMISVMMTSSGYISAARVGRLPDSILPIITESISTSPQPLPPHPTSNFFSDWNDKFERKTKKRMEKDWKRSMKMAVLKQAKLSTLKKSYIGKKKLKKQNCKEDSIPEILINVEFLRDVDKPRTVSTAIALTNDSVNNKIRTNNNELKLKSEIDKQKLNIFKRITTKKEKDLCAKSPSFGEIMTTITRTDLCESVSSGQTTTIRELSFHKQSSDYCELEHNETKQTPVPLALVPDTPQSLTSTKMQGQKKNRKKVQPQLELPLPLDLPQDVSSIIHNRKLTSKVKAIGNKNLRTYNQNKKSGEMFLPSDSINVFKDCLNHSQIIKESLLMQKVSDSTRVSTGSPQRFPSKTSGPNFPFYQFSTTPGLIPTLGGIYSSHLDVGKQMQSNQLCNRGQKLSKIRPTLDLEPVVPLYAESEKSCCNIASLMPESIKMEMSTQISQSQLDKHIKSSVNETQCQSWQATTSAPIEISDDEYCKNESDNITDNQNVLTTIHSNVVDTLSRKSINDTELIKPDNYDIVFEVDLKSEYQGHHNDKLEKRKERKKRGKDGKMKKKKDKKDKLKNKEKKRAKGEKYRKKAKMVSLCGKKYSQTFYKAQKFCVIGDDNLSDTSAVPKLTLKFGVGNTSQEEVLENKISITNQNIENIRDDSFDEATMYPVSMDEHRESSPELARISPLVTRPPKQRSKEKSRDVDQTTAKTTPSMSSISRGPGRPRASGINNTRNVSTTAAATVSVINTVPQSSANQQAQSIDPDGNQVWICPACGRVDDGTPMIGCDGCDAWYHWVCVGIQVPPDENEDWYCRVCITKKQEAYVTDKKRKRKKKN